MSWVNPRRSPVKPLSTGATSSNEKGKFSYLQIAKDAQSSLANKVDEDKRCAPQNVPSRFIPLTLDKDKRCGPNNIPTHFISLPLSVHPKLKTELENFQNTIMGTTSSETRIDRSIFINPRTFHLTVLMLKLETEEKVEFAVDVLKSSSSQVMNAIGDRPIFLTLNGLDIMKGSEAKTRVVYAKVEEDSGRDRLLRACDVIITAFRESGLVAETEVIDKLKLHATVMNVLYRRGRPKKRDDYFNAQGVFEQYGCKKWGKYLIREAHLSQRFVYDKNGYYHCCGSIPFPVPK